MSDDRSNALYRAIRVGEYNPNGCRGDDDDGGEPENPLRELPVGDVSYPSLGQPVDPEMRDDGSRGRIEEVQMRKMQRLLTDKKAYADKKFSEEIKKACGYSPKVAGKT